MGQTIRQLAAAPLSNQAVFNNRMVVEACESFHFHYRNLRINVSYADWPAFAKGFADSYHRWEKQGKPFGGHTELCRKIVATNPKEEGIQVNLNHNLYKLNKGKIFSKGTDLADDAYIHLKIRDLRLEMPIEEFNTLAEVIGKAAVTLKESEHAISSEPNKKEIKEKGSKEGRKESGATVHPNGKESS